MRMRPTGLWPRRSAAAQIWAPPKTSAKTPKRAKPTAARPAARPTDASSGASSSASAPADSSSIETPMMAASAPHRMARMPSKDTWRSTGGPGGCLLHADVELDARGGVMARRHGEPEQRAVATRRPERSRAPGGAASRCRCRRTSGTARTTTRRARRRCGRRSTPARRAGAWRRAGPRTATGESTRRSGVDRSAATNALRMRSTAGAIDGKSIATSSPNQRASSRVSSAARTTTESPPDGRNVIPDMALRVP